MKLNEISFPIYKLGKRKPIIEEGVTFYLNKTEKEDGTLVYFPAIIDDTNIEGNSLARRRLKLLVKGEKLFKLRYAIFFISDMLKFTKGATWFIDSAGKSFEYIKTKRVPLVFKKIKEVIPIKSGGVVIEIQNIPYRFKSLFKPLLEQKYAGLLYVDQGYILYGFYDKLYDKTTRMI
jgi:hypothetical protein